ncbi:DUF6263 family protein [Psychroserpens sp. SPM9]|uniref:DUF6263 family protein n=1 Tax=Psychroserpens sp. SPM9 TaxID=2975598 RepID=UPI0021A52D40|nr:DUF6263 family protein [Psychroserpens sp. SPM9]MDG5492123.1 DUF6263 family protein [Psychroserpens sp. SPM9]
MKSLLLRFFVAFIVTTNLITAQTKLAYNLNVGDEFKVNQIAIQDIVQDMNGQKHEMKNLLEGDFTFAIEAVNDSVYHIKFKFDRFKMVSTSNLMGELFNINTADPIEEDDIEGKLFSQLVKTDLKMIMYKNGKIKSITGSKALINNMVNAAGDFDEFTKELMKESMKKEFSNESLAKSFEQMTYIYPSKKVAKGDTWNNKFEGDLSSENTWTLKSIKKDDVEITGQSTITFNTIDEDLEMKLTGEMTSDLITSFETGFVKTMKTHSVAKGNSILHNMNDLEVPTTITSNITYKVEKHVQ